MKEPRLPFSLLVLVILLIISSHVIGSGCEIRPSIYGKITDASSGLPVPGATILIWDLNRNLKETHSTNESGDYYISSSILTWNDQYLIYAFQGNLSEETFNYVPALYEFKLSYGETSKNISMQLLPGASIILEGDFYCIESSYLSKRFLVTVNPEYGYPSGSGIKYLTEYGDSSYAWLLGLNRRTVVVPAGTPVKMIAEAVFMIDEYKMEFGFLYKMRSFRVVRLTLDDQGRPFVLAKGSKISLQISEYSLKHGMNVINNKILEVSSRLDEAQSVGFVVFEERASLSATKWMINDAEKYLEGKNYTACWIVLSDMLTRTNLILLNINNMRLISLSSAAYMPAVLSIFSVILAFFFFEEKERKFISSIILYALFLVTLYFIYPGARLIMDENKTFFLGSAIISIAATLAVIFGIPRVWKERQVEGEVSVKSAVSVIFSMGKRQIRRKKLRGFFTIFSTIILVLAFVSLTSFGTVFDIVSENINVSPSAGGVLVKRLWNATSILSSPLSLSDLDTLPKIFKIENLAPRLENTPSVDPIAQIINPVNNKTVPIYGVEGISPTNDPILKSRSDFITVGRNLNESGEDEVLISRSMASMLDINLNALDMGTQHVHLLISGVYGFRGNFTVKGVFDDSKYMGLIDLDGQSFGPIRLLPEGDLRVCNSTEVILMHWKTANRLQEGIEAMLPQGAPQIAVLYEIVFQFSETANIQDMIRTLIYSFHYDVFITSNNAITHYLIGAYYQVKGAGELIIPLAMVILNIGTVMLNAVYERRNELKVLSMLGLNPAHIRLIFLAEAVIIGMVGGGIGYLFGLGFYRIISFFGQSLLVREKLEWWWSAIGFAIALIASIVSAIRPAILAVKMYTPSMIRKFKLAEHEEKTRREEIFKVYQAKELSMPVKVLPSELPFFIGFLLNRLEEMRTGTFERVEEIKELPEIENVKGELVKTIRFDYYLTVSGKGRGTKNELICIKSPEESYYRVKLVSNPASPGMPEDAIDRTIDFIHSLSMEWSKNKKRIIGA